jgi:hypothetical protein
MGLPNVIEPRHEFIGVNLGLTFCREGMERRVSQFQVLKYPPSIAPRPVRGRCNIDSEFGGIRHHRIMRRGGIWSQTEFDAGRSQIGSKPPLGRLIRKQPEQAESHPEK